MVAVVVTALLFDPVRKWIQEKLDQYFFRTGYDYRRTLIEFGRELSSETDLDKMLSSLVDRLARTLLVDRIAIFLGNADSSRFELAKAFGIAHVTGLDLSFLAKPRIEDAADTSFSKTRVSCRAKTQAGARGYRTPRSELLHSLPRPPKDDRVPRTRQNHGGRFPFQRRRRTARSTRRIHRHRHSERTPLRLARAKGQRVRAA
jgi:hypothetical protein